MMRVYQPLCPDITFRLAADLSPDTLEESEESTPSSSTSSSSEEEELKLKLYQETLAHGHNTRHQNYRFPAGSATAAPASASTKNAKDIYNQGHVTDVTSSPFEASTSGSSSTSSQPPSVTSSAFTVDNGNLCGEKTDGVEKCYEELNCNQASDSATKTAEPATSEEIPVPQAGVVQSSVDAAKKPARHGTKRSADDTTSPSFDRGPPCSIEKGHHDVSLPEDGGSAREDGNDDDDDESIEDVSISHNVPMCPSPPPLSPVRSPLVSRRVMEAAEEMGGASGSSSDSDGSALAKCSGMHLDIQKSSSKYCGPYTLACEVTPSPMQENITMVNTLSVASANASGHASAATTPTTSGNFTTTANAVNPKVPRRPRKLPEIPRKHQGLATASSTHVKSIFDEIQEALIKEVNEGVFDAPPLASDMDPAQQYPFIHKHMGHLFDKKRLLIGYATVPPRPSRSRNTSTSSVASEAGAAASWVEQEMSYEHAQERSSGVISSTVAYGQERRRKNSDGDGSKRHPSSTISTPYHDLEVTHRGMHRFIPRHADEVQIGIGDPIHVIKEFDDLWCEGVNLRSGERGIFPAMYANDLKFLEDSDGDDEHWKFTMRFLGTVEVSSSSGDFALCQAINKVAQHGRIKTASLCTLEINQYGIRMIDKSKEGHESQKFTNFFALKNISFCGTHPSNNRYFAFITKHPRELRFACHVFHSDRSTHRARDALGHAFKRFYQEYMAFTHPTEDIWIE